MIGIFGSVCRLSVFRPGSARVLGLLLVTAAIMLGDSRAYAQFFDEATGDVVPQVVQRGLTVSAQPYPVGDISITREEITSSSFVLRMKNLDLMSNNTQKARMQTWMLAGLRGRVPSVHVQTAEFVYIVDGRETSSTTVVPEQLRQSFVRVNDIGQLRQFWVYSLNMTTSSPGGGSGVWVCKDAAVLVELGAAPEGAMSAGMADRFKASASSDPLAQAMLLNPNISPDYYVMDYSDPVESWQSWNTRVLSAAATGDMFKFNIYRGGLYRLSARELAQVTSGTMISTPATAWRAYRNGAEIPLMADPDQPESMVYLPVSQGNGENLHTDVYWLDTSGKENENSPAPLRYDLAEKATAAAATGAAQTTGTFSVLHREFKDYNPRLKANQESDRWVWTDLAPGTPARLELQMPAYFDPPATATVTAVVKYGFANFPPVVPSLVMNMSNHLESRTTLTTQMGQVELQLPVSSLRPGKNEIALQLQYPPEGITKRPVTIQSIETRWVQPLEVPERSSYFFKTAAGTTAPLTFAEPLPAGVGLFSVEPGVPQTVSVSKGRAAVAAPGQAMLLANTNGAQPVVDIQQVHDPLDLQKVVSAKSVIVTAPELQKSVTTLADQQTSRDLEVQVYETDSLFDTFAYGNRNPEAISAALRYMFYRAPGTPPVYVTLVGESSDYRGDPHMAPAGVQKDMVPTSTANRPEAIQGDEKYAASVGGDLIADFVLGRIPAATAAQLDGYLAKVEKFMAEPAGEWSRRTEFVMDDNDEFPDVVDQITARTLSPLSDNSLLRQWDYEYVQNMRVPGRKRSWQATEAVVDSFNRGLSVMNFFGHGGPNLWSHERLFHLSDLPLVHNGARLPLITCASCDNAWISYPMAPVNASMGELLVLKPDGGGIGLFGPVSGASPYEHSTLVQGLMEAILRVQLRRTGEATFYAKNMYYASTRSSSIPEQYVLLGDPTVRIKMPVVDAMLSAPPEDVRIKTNVTNRIAIGLGSGFTLMSTGTLTLRDSSTDRVLAEKTVYQRQSQWELELPGDYLGGCVMALLEFTDNGEPRMSGTSARVLPPLPDEKTNDIKRISLEGQGFDIRPAAGVSSTEKDKIIAFEIKPLAAETSGTVQITALSGGKPLGMPQVVNLGTSETYSQFQVTAPASDVAGSGNVQIIASRPHSVTVATFSLPREKSADLEMVPGTAKVYSLSGRLTAGATVVMEAQVRNIGNAPVPRSNIQGMLDSPTTGTELMSINDSTSERLDNIKPGETRTVQFRWEQSRPGTFENAYLVVNRNKVSPESNYNNNSIAMPAFTVEKLGNFFVSKFDVSPAFVTMGTPVTVTATLNHDNVVQNHPVKVEIGWERAFDNATTSTEETVTFQDGVANLTKQVIAPEGYTHLFLTVNADHEVEEAMTSDNTTRTASMMAYELPEFQKAISLGNSLMWGVAYNATMPFEAQLQVAGDMTSNTWYILPELKDVTSGSATQSAAPDDNAWSINPWQILADGKEQPGALSMRVPVPEMDRDVPGKVIGHLVPYQPAPIPLQVRTVNRPTWFLPPDRGSNTNLQLMDFGVVPMENDTVSWEMRKAGKDTVNLSFISFYPQAMQWDSVPYQVPARLQRKELWFAMDTKQNQWQKSYVEWRNGHWANDQVEWEQWNSHEDQWTVPFSAGEFVQFRVIAAPKPGMQPYIENFRITK